MVEHAEGQRIAQVIDTARLRQGPKISVRSAAALAGISEGWWRQLVAGEQKRGSVSLPVVGSAETYLAMARAVGVEAEVASMLGREVVPSDPGSRQSPMTIDAITNDPNLIPEAKAHLLNQYELLLRIAPPVASATDSHQKAARARMDRLRTDVRGQRRPDEERERGTGTQGDG